MSKSQVTGQLLLTKNRWFIFLGHIVRKDGVKTLTFTGAIYKKEEAAETVNKKI